VIADWLEAEEPIIARLRDKVPGARTVIGMSEFSRAHIEQNAPAVVVMYDGDRLPDSAGEGQAVLAAQRWVVIVGVRNVRDAAAGGAARREAGPLLTAVIKALSGWAPGQMFTGFVRVTSPRAGYEPGFAWFGLAFETRTISMGDDA